MVKTVGKKFGRALHFDFHTSPGIENIFGNFDAEQFAQALKDAHVDHINMAARCNMGYSYYNTKIGKKYPGLNGRDPFKEIIYACHKRDIDVIAYINIGLDHEFAADHTDWLKMDLNGAVYRGTKKDNFFRCMCYNSGYRAHLLGEIKEICEYDIDGLFCDCFVQRHCFCPTCVSDMKRRGYAIDSEEAVMEYQNTVRFELIDDIKRAMGEKKDKIKVFFNGISMGLGLNTHAEIECLSNSPAWGYDFFETLAAYTRTVYRDRVFMSGRFQNSWGDFGGVKPLASMQNDLYLAMMNSFGISFGDHLHPIDGFENEVKERIKSVMEEYISYEPYVKNSNNAVEVGIVYKMSDANSFQPLYVKGAARMLKELKVQYNVYDESGNFERDGVRLIIIEGDDKYDDAFVERLTGFVKRGGKVIFSGKSIYLGKRAGLLDYIDEIQDDSSDNSYYTVNGSYMRWASYLPSITFKNAGGKECARYVKNVLNFVWDGRQSAFYRPQGEVSDLSAAVLGTDTAAVCFDILGAYAENFLIEHRELYASLINALMPNTLIESPNMPKTVSTAITENENARVLHIKTTYPEYKMSRGIIEEHNYMKSVPISVKGEYEVYVLPNMQKCECKIENGRTVFESGDILGYRAYLLK
jgi:hypothetical protein